MDATNRSRMDDENFAPQSPVKNNSNGIKVLLIGRDQQARLYTDEVLRREGFNVRAIAPWEARTVVNDGVGAYSLVVFSNTLNTNDISDIGTQLRRHSPQTKTLLLLGPDVTPASAAQFDEMLEGLAGPVALIHAVRRLAEPAIQDGAAGLSA
jgi:DNA-binding NtrC family response regulator